MYVILFIINRNRWFPDPLHRPYNGFFAVSFRVSLVIERGDHGPTLSCSHWQKFTQNAVIGGIFSHGFPTLFVYSTGIS